MAAALQRPSMPSRQAAAESVKCAGEDPKGLMFPLLPGFRVASSGESPSPRYQHGRMF